MRIHCEVHDNSSRKKFKTKVEIFVKKFNIESDRENETFFKDSHWNLRRLVPPITNIWVRKTAKIFYVPFWLLFLEGNMVVSVGEEIVEQGREGKMENRYQKVYSYCCWLLAAKNISHSHEIKKKALERIVEILLVTWKGPQSQTWKWLGKEFIHINRNFSFELNLW